MSWIMQIAGGAVSAKGTMQQARSEVATLKSDARVGELQSGRDEEAQRREARQIIGMQAASMAQAGGGIDEGVLRRSAVNAELDALNIRYRGRARSSGLIRDARQVAKQAPYLAGAQLLSSSGSAYHTRAVEKSL